MRHVYLPTGESREELTGIRVTELMHPDIVPLPADADMTSAKQRLEQEKCHSWPVANGNYLLGIISNHQIEAATPVPDTVLDLIRSGGEYPYVHLDHPLSYALERMGSKGVDVVPVLSRANVHQMYGVVTLKDVRAAYGVSITDAVAT
jgi:chloride channel protein, CIC family